ncbi:hypothetical protein M569_05310, partial [Genlisea aurea]
TMGGFSWAAFFVLILASLAHAYDSDPLQDICVAVNDSVRVNGKICKDPDEVTADDFFYSGLHVPRNVTNFSGSAVTTVFVDELSGLNTLGVALARIDFAPGGVNPPHEHPRASEALYVAEGELYAGFILSNPREADRKHRLVAKTLRRGDVFLFPRGLIHFQLNVGGTRAVAFASFGSQNPGVVTVANSLFGSEPLVHPQLLAKAFQLSEETVQNLQSLTWMDN